MGVTEFACPGCGQAQKVRAPNGVEVSPRLCAACQEAENAEAQRDREREQEEAGTGKKPRR